jgi:hypothetical protein
MTDNLFIYGLFNDAVRSSKSVPPTGRMITDKRIREGKRKLPGRETYHSYPSGAEVNNGENIKPLTNTSSRRNA